MLKSCKELNCLCPNCIHICVCIWCDGRIMTPNCTGIFQCKDYLSKELELKHNEN